MVAAPARSEYDPAIVGAGSVGPPAADTVPFPVTWRKTPLTGTSPLTLVLFSRTSDLGPSYLVQLANRRPRSSDP